MREVVGFDIGKEMSSDLGGCVVLLRAVKGSEKKGVS